MNTEAMAKCPQCGAAMPPDALAGLCPRCVMAMNLKTETVLTGEQVPSQPPLPPEQIAPHFPQLEILECLGRGGMGVVYKARQKTLNRFVALKLLAPERVNDPKFAERFTREAQALAALNHPNIVTIHDFGRAGGFYFLLMEFVDGVNLRHLLRSRKFAPEEALAIVPPLCDALQFAHERGLVHRDIKPENILLDKSGRVKVADFGIAKMLGNGRGESAGSAASPANLTQSVVGTPGYSAPEQKSDPQRVDSRADIYSLGVVFYEMLTGELPGKQIEPPSHKVSIDVRLDEIVLRALENNPELRYQQASVLKTQVETITTARSEPDSTSALLMKIQKTTLRFVTFGVGFVLVCLLLLLGMSSEAIGARTWGYFRLFFEILAAAGIAGLLFVFFRAMITRTPEAWHSVKFALPWMIFMALGISFGFLSPYLLRQPARSLTIRAFIDGSDIIKVSGYRLWIEHDTGSLPGKAIYVNGQAWTPIWTTNLVSSKGVSSEFDGVNPAFQTRLGQGIQLTKRNGRGVVSVEQFPSADNDETLAVRVDDEPFGGADWYEFVISWDQRTKSTAAVARPATKNNLSSSVAAMLKDPQQREALRAQQKAVVDQMYGALSVPADRLDAFKELLLDRQMAMAEPGLSAMSGTAANRTQAMQTARAIKAEYDRKIQNLLGPQEYRVFQEYDKTVMERMLAQAFQNTLPADARLSATQEDALIFAMHDEATASRKLMENSLPSNSILTGDDLSKQLKLFQQNTLKRASTILTPQQFNQFQMWQEQMAAVQTTALKQMFGNSPAEASQVH